MTRDEATDLALGVLVDAFPSKSEDWLRPFARRIAAKLVPETQVVEYAPGMPAPERPRWPMLPAGYTITERGWCNRLTAPSGRVVDLPGFLPTNQWAVEKYLIPALMGMGAAPQKDWRRHVMA